MKKKIDVTVCVSPGGCQQLVFLMNIVLNIQKMAAKYCCCRNLEICLVCQAKYFYQDYEF